MYENKVQLNNLRYSIKILIYVSNLYKIINNMKLTDKVIKCRIERNISCDLITMPEEIEFFAMKAKRKYNTNYQWKYLNSIEAYYGYSVGIDHSLVLMGSFSIASLEFWFTRDGRR